MNVDIQNDEFQSYFQKQYEPKVLITYSDNPLGVSIILLLKCSLAFECCYQGQLFQQSPGDEQLGGWDKLNTSEYVVMSGW